jgi:formamidopyrimidine-DNA glycosylase
METGLFTYRKAGKLPTGEKIILLKVGGRTSAVVPSLQNKTGAVATEITGKNTVEIKAEEGDSRKPANTKSKKRKATDDIKQEDVKKENVKSPKQKRRG